ncbi:Uroporphyrinogen decarboxylase [Mycena kentingensis (nom. inval.)]|nr:Uroporphyrinogen decarboxylase [Mycena kentingensis (nom. inval.)]
MSFWMVLPGVCLDVGGIMEVSRDKIMSFPPLKNDLLLRAARGEKTERAPVWVMRQAGRYLPGEHLSPHLRRVNPPPEFRELRKSHEFFEICRTPDLATEITLQPIRRYSGLVDAAIIFSDILVIPQAMGMEVLMNPGPQFPDPLNTPADIAKLREIVDVDKELGYVFKALTQTRIALDGEVPLIGFCGAPWTLFVYMVEGGGSKTYQKVKTWIFKHPEESKALIMRIAEVCIDFSVGQVKAGAQLLQVFDSNAGELSPYDFDTFSRPSLEHIARGVRARLAAENIPVVPLTLFAKGANHAIGSLAESSGYDTLGLDWLVDPAEARRLVKGKVALQGNMDPNVLYGGRDAIESTVKRMCAGFLTDGGPQAWISNLGHGITPGVDPEDLRHFFECVHKFSAAARP